MGLFKNRCSGAKETEPEKSEELIAPRTDSRQSENEIDQHIQQMRQEVLELKQTIDQLQSKLEEKENRLKVLLEQSSLTDYEANKNSGMTAGELSNIADNQKEMMRQMKAMSELLDSRIKELIEDRMCLSNKLEEKASRLEELTTRVQEDRYRKDKVKILRRNINLRNLISHVVEDYREEKPQKDGYETPAANFLEQQLEEIIKAIDADLQQEMLTPLVNGVEGSDFDAEYQEIVERQPTERPELDGKVYRSVSPGYVWTLPYIFKPRINETGEEIHTYKFLLRSEDVITYKYEMKEQKK